MKTDRKLIGAGLLTAVTASLCCITPVLVLIAGTSGIAASTIVARKIESRIEEIKKASGIPLVLHGSSGVPDEMVTKAVKSGINKVNFDTELKLANLAALNKFLTENPGVYDVRKIYKPCIEAMKEVVKSKIRACGSENKSWI